MHSTWYRSRSTWSIWRFAIDDGRVEGGLATLPHSMGSPLNALMSISLREPPGFKWHFRWRNDSTYIGVAVPLWFPAAVALVPTAFAWRLDTLARRRAKLAACPKCSYSTIGLAPSAVCPECGFAAPPSSPALR